MRPSEALGPSFEDLGDCALLPDRPQPGGLEAATRLVAQLHLAFAGHGLLPEWIDERLGGPGERFYAEWVRRAAQALATIETSRLSLDRLALRDRLSRRLDALLAEEPGRTRRLREAGWPVTLLHGDLWPQNVLLSPLCGDARRARLIDWDQAGVGPVVYDLSTFVSRLSSPVRASALRLYRRAVRAGRLAPSRPGGSQLRFRDRRMCASCQLPDLAGRGCGRGRGLGVRRSERG